MRTFTSDQLAEARRARFNDEPCIILDQIDEEMSIGLAESGADRDHTERELGALRERRFDEILGITERDGTTPKTIRCP